MLQIWWGIGITLEDLLKDTGSLLHQASVVSLDQPVKCCSLKVHRSGIFIVKLEPSGLWFHNKGKCLISKVVKLFTLKATNSSHTERNIS